MRTLLLVTVWCALAACSKPRSPNDLPAETWGTNDYVKAGVPAPDHTWTVAEHRTALEVLTKETAGHRERLPHLGGVKSGAVFARIVEASPSAEADRAAVDPNQAYAVHADRFEVLNQISKLYVANETATGSSEFYAIIGRVLHEAMTLDVGAVAFLAQFPADDPSRATREGGFAKMRSGWSTMLLGSLLMVSDFHAPEAAAIGLSHDLAAVLPTMYPHAEPGTKEKIKQQLDKMHAVFKDGALKSALPPRL
jgi:hypothetical protein